ncbi:MAG: AAA family ATPase [Armatimonadota bacterium]|nr:AAA family ATPase [Armatimonadota bacterium]
MQLLELQLTNFKRFTGQKFTFTPGINLVWGPNESGKSTLHEAICCALFGRERGQAVENWNSDGTCSVRLIYSADGETFLIERKLTAGVQRLCVLRAGEETDVITEKSAVEEKIAEHLGIRDKTIFNNTISIRQAEVSKLTSNSLSSVGNEIQRVLTGTAQGSASKALSKLRRQQTDIIGPPRPKNPREYENITNRLQKLAETLAQARASRDRIVKLEDEIRLLEEKLSHESKRLSELEELLARHTRWAELKQKQLEIGKLHESVFARVRKINDSLADLKFAQKELEEDANLIGKADEIADHLAKLYGKRTALEDRLSQLKQTLENLPERAGILAQAIWAGGALAFAAAAIVLGLAKNPLFFLLIIPAIAILAKLALSKGLQRWDEHQHLNQLITSTQEELKAVNLEEQSILAYLKCPDLERAFARIKAYRSRAARTHELEVSIKTLLDGRNLEDWQKQEADLARELSIINHELEEQFAEYSPTTEEVERWRSEHASLLTSTANASERLSKLRGELEAEHRNMRDMACVEGELEFLHKRKAELEFLNKAYGEAIAALEAVIQHVSEEYLPVLSEKATECLSHITNGRYTAVRLTPDWVISLDCTEKTGIAPSIVSTGTSDQVFFALRAACGELLSSGHKLPIILDDPFVSFDRERLERTLLFLGKLASRNQILLLTHDPFTLEWAKQTSCTILDLSKL